MVEYQILSSVCFSWGRHIYLCVTEQLFGINVTLRAIFHMCYIVVKTIYNWEFKTIALSVQFSRSVMAESLRTHELQHASPPCSSPTASDVNTQTHVHCVGGTIQPSQPLLSPSCPAFNLSQHWGVFK